MGRTARSLASLMAVALLAACTAPPRLPYDGGIGIADVIRNVRCELANARVQNIERHPWLKNWAIAVELTLDVIESGTAGASAQIVVPVNLNDSVGLGGILGQTRRARNISSITFAGPLASMTQEECAAVTGSRSMLRGNLGLTTWITRAADSIDAARIVGQTNRIGYIIEFGLVSSGGLDPSFNIIKLGDFELGGKVGLAADRNDTHIIAVGMAPINAPPLPPPPLPVFVTNLDQFRPGAAPPRVRVDERARPVVRVPEGGIPAETRNNLNDIIRSLKQTQTADE